MDKSQKSLASVVTKLLAAVINLSSEDVERLADKSFDLEIRVVRKRLKDDVEHPPIEDFKVVVDKLSAFDTREEASDFLLRTFETKRPLEQLARALDIQVQKQDKLDNIRDKVIEATVGARIRSEAIKGKSG